jgi:hypothetical protein
VSGPFPWALAQLPEFNEGFTMRKFLPAVVRNKLARKPRTMIGWTAGDGIGLTDTHPAFNAAERVKLALTIYAGQHDAGEPLETVASDFLADLFHLLTVEGEDPAHIVSRAELHFEAEYNAEPVFA